MSHMSSESEPLQGLRVVELSTSVTGAQIGQFLSDFGAEVVLVEPPGGSRLRSQPAFPLWARGKKSVELDVKREQDRAEVDGLLASADVLVETFRPATREMLGLDHASVASTNSRLVHASITGFG